MHRVQAQKAGLALRLRLAAFADPGAFFVLISCGRYLLQGDLSNEQSP
jgi:hypothetical protein